MKKIIGLILTCAIIMSLPIFVQAVDFGGSGYNFVCADGGRYLNVYAGKDADGTNVCVWERDGSPEQSYTISDCGNGKYKLYPACSSSRVIDVNRGNSYNNPLKAGLNVDLWRTNDAPAQEFYITHVGNNLYKIELSALSGHVLQANNPQKNNGNVTLEKYTGASNQHWKILKNGVQVTEPCTHKSITKKNEKTNVSQNDQNTHIVTVTYDKACGDCGKTLESGLSETKNENHTFSGNKCTKCGYEKAVETESTKDECRHTKTYEIISLKGEEFKGQKDEKNHLKTRWVDIYCSDCKKLLQSNVEKTVDEEHVFLNDTCTICLYTKAVEKPGNSTPSVSKTSFTPGESISLTWSSAKNAATYDIHIEIPGVSEPYRIDSGFSGTSGSVVINDEGTYRLTVYAINDAGYTRGDSVNVTVKKAVTEKTGYVYNTDGANLNMRSGPGTKYSVVAKIKEGSAVTVTGDATSGFYPIKYGNNSGFASVSYITFTTPAATAASDGDLSGKVGKRLANFSATAYNASSPLKNYKGQCTWYCWGRAYEKTGIKLNTVNNAKTWLSKLNTRGATVVWNSSAPRKNSIAVKTSGKYGHVLFIEDVVGNTVYYTEANVPWNDVVDWTDGILKKTTKANMAKMCNGYIYLN